MPAHIEARTGSAALVGLLVFAQLGPLLLLSIPAGVPADRFPRAPYLIVMQSVQLLFSVLLAAFVATGSPLWTLFGACRVLGLGALSPLVRPAPPPAFGIPPGER